MKRKSLSKKTRFEVFKRDSFTCQYCGRSAPEVVLQVDHIKPVAKESRNWTEFRQGLSELVSEAGDDVGDI